MQYLESVQPMLQNIAETASTYWLGQVVIKQLDRVLWTVEKSARWAVPPPVDSDEETTNPPELVRPLPWLPFLWLLVVLRITRVSLSIANLLMGKPPVRAADMVTYIQSKRRYLRALKYQGHRNMRARGSGGSLIMDLFKLPFRLARALCTSSANRRKDEDTAMIKTKQSKDRESGYASPAQEEAALDKLIEKMVDMCYDSSDDSDYTLTNAASEKGDTTSITSTEDSSLDKTANETDMELVSSTPDKSYSSPATPECSNIHEYVRLGSEDISGVKSAKNESLNLIASEKQTDEVVTASAEIKKANGQPTSKNTNRDNSSHNDSDVPTSKIETADESNANGGREGLYYQPNSAKGDGRGQTPASEQQTNTGRNIRHKTRESKIRTPAWKKFKK